MCSDMFTDLINKYSSCNQKDSVDNMLARDTQMWCKKNFLKFLTDYFNQSVEGRFIPL